MWMAFGLWPSSRSCNRAAALEGMENVLRALTGAGKKVVLMVDNPTLPEPRDCLARRTGSGLLNALLPSAINPQCMLGLARHLELSQQYRSLLSQLAAEFPGAVRVFDTTRYLCDAETGICPPARDGRLLYSYSDHLSGYASMLIGRDLNAFLCDHSPVLGSATAESR